MGIRYHQLHTSVLSFLFFSLKKSANMSAKIKLFEEFSKRNQRHIQIKTEKFNVEQILALHCNVSEGQPKI